MQLLYCGYVQKFTRYILSFLLLCVSSTALPAQEWAEGIRLSPQAQVSMVTIYPGEELYSMFGHTAIRIYDPLQNIDILYNYGQASVPFDAAFVPRFVSGDLPFILGVSDTQRSFEYYRKYEDRSMYEQLLQLSYSQRQEVFDFLVDNARKENRTYIYDFFFDNCTTRVRDLFLELYDSDFHYHLNAPQTFRQAIAPYLVGKPYIALGIDLMLGMKTDTKPAEEQRMYLPLQLMDAVEEASLERAGKKIDFVKESYSIYQQSRSAPAPGPLLPKRLLWGAFLLVLLCTVFAKKSGVFCRIMDTGFFLLAGVIGVSSLLLWTLSGYEMTTWNLNLLWAWPTHLPMAFFLLKKELSSLKIRRSVLSLYFAAAAVMAALFVLSSAFLPQEIPSAVIPLGLILGLRGLIHTHPELQAYLRAYLPFRRKI